MKYEISNGTLLIMPDKNESLVYEDYEKFSVDQSPFKIMEESCKYFGSTYDGRKEGAREILGAQYKLPIIVEDSNNLVVFPTNSPDSDDCVCISLKRVRSYQKVDNNSTKVLFDNGVEIVIPTSYRSFENQISRAARLDLIMRNRKMKK